MADTPVGRIGLLIGHDASFPEAGRILALKGCDLIVCPAAIKQRFSTPHPGSLVPQNYPIPTGADPYHWHHFRVRAGENNVFFAFSNVLDPGNGYPGLGGVFGPDSFEFPRCEAIAGDGEGMATAAVDTTIRHRLSDQRRASERSGRDADAAQLPRIDQDRLYLTPVFRTCRLLGATMPMPMPVAAMHAQYGCKPRYWSLFGFATSQTRGM